MIYVDLRHFVQEWIEIAPPNYGDWPWRRTIYLINLYPIPISEALQQMPAPFISILVDGVDKLVPVDRIYRNQYKKESFNLLRRYLYNPLVDKDKDIGPSRFNWSCNTYNQFEWQHTDTRLRKLLSSRPHVRHSAYNSEVFSLIDERLAKLSEASDGALCAIAENLFDCTTNAKSAPGHYPETMIMGVPILGLLAPIKKSRNYKVINGCLVITKEPVVLALPKETSYQAYTNARRPFYDFQKGKTMIPDETKNVVFIAVDVQCGSFSFYEYTRFNAPTTHLNYRRMLTHHFTLYPYIVPMERKVDDVADMTMAMIKHDIIEGIIPDVKANEKFYGKHPGNLFARSDLPRGFFKSKNGVFTTYEL